ncbi:YidB family protein [Methylobacterium sp. J-076]|uniref:YidB family protein n=1 Tax=Methylobacterium sp. J-076 TaxID=2836655 RepID=UPI001FB9531F|nr:YidB family protein [Methylobacterium sp. J-076]MCJ2013235.1 YidB family protein [Methylobacterium sp. J-076]
MGLMDGVKNVLGDLAAATERTIAEVGGQNIPMAFAKFYPGGLAGFLDRLRENGHGSEVDTWLQGRDPRPVPAGAIEACLPEPVAEGMARDLSLSRERLGTALAEFLPATVAGASEGGRLTPQPVFSSTQVVGKAAG